MTEAKVNRNQGFLNDTLRDGVAHGRTDGRWEVRLGFGTWRLFRSYHHTDLSLRYISYKLIKSRYKYQYEADSSGNFSILRAFPLGLFQPGVKKSERGPLRVGQSLRVLRSIEPQ